MKKLVDINELLTHCLTHRQILINKGEPIPSWLLTYTEDLKFRIKIGHTREWVTQLSLDELKVKNIIDHEPVVIEKDDDTEVIEKPVKVKKERAVKAKRMPRKETALSYMRELIPEIEDDEAIAQKILDKYPGSTYTKHMVKFQRKKMESENE